METAACQAGSYRRLQACTTNHCGVTWQYNQNHGKSSKIQVSVASHLKGLPPIICTWLDSPRAALYAGSYCKLVACTILELL